MKDENKTTAGEAVKTTLSRKLPPRLDIRVDWAFHRIFSNKKHLQKIIRDLLEMDIEVLEYLPNELVASSEHDKRSVFDVICRNSGTGETFVLEMQNNYEADMPDRLYYYGGSLLHNQMRRGEKKYEVQSVVVCCIATYSVPHNGPVPEGKVFFRYRMMENETHEIYDGDKLNICFLELSRFEHYLDKDSDLRQQWCWIFENMSIFVERPKELDPSFDELIEDASTQKLTAMEREDYLKALEISERDRVVLYEGGYYMGHRDGIEEGRAAGIEEGLATGREEGRAAALGEFAARLKQMGYSDAEIKKMTDVG